jgi:hypothetical protein
MNERLGSETLRNVTERDGQRKKLPSWVKCVVCGKPPIGADWLIERTDGKLIHINSCQVKKQ